jgi:glutaredoxin 3
MKKYLLIYTINYCPFCESAKKLATSQGYPFKEIKITDDNDPLWDRLEKETKFKTVPQIFIVDDEGYREFIGGYREMSKLESQGVLKEKLK